MMPSFRSSFLRLFTTGFFAGAIALVAMQPAEATRTIGQHLHIVDAIR